MSGGSYNYAYRHLEEFADNLDVEGSCCPAPPAVRHASPSTVAKWLAL
jgi:hypothetical protein